MMNKGKEHIWFHYLLIEIQLYTSFGIKYIPPEELNKIRYKWITQNIFRTQDDESIILGFLLYCFHRIYTCRKVF